MRRRTLKNTRLWTCPAILIILTLSLSIVMTKQSSQCASRHSKRVSQAHSSPLVTYCGKVCIHRRKVCICLGKVCKVCSGLLQGLHGFTYTRQRFACFAGVGWRALLRRSLRRSRAAVPVLVACDPVSSTSAASSRACGLGHRRRPRLKKRT